MVIGHLSGHPRHLLDETLMNSSATSDELWHAGDIGSIERVDRITPSKPLLGCERQHQTAE